MLKPLGTTAAALLVAAGVIIPGPAAATPTAPSAGGCGVAVGSVTAGGDHREGGVIAASPPQVPAGRILGRDVYPDGAVRFSSSISRGDDGISIAFASGYSVLGDALYHAGYSTGEDGVIEGGIKRIGGGWGSFVALNEGLYYDKVLRYNMYGLRNDGTLFRWTIDSKGAWRSRVSAPGFAAVKSMALISSTKTYDTFLANTRGGALYTIHIPATAPMKPIVKLVRSKTWQGFETLIAQQCGQYGSVVLGIDRDTHTGYMYAMGHATGATTVIQSFGKVPSTFTDPVYFHLTDGNATWKPPFGE
ncbi:hypothetical protein [Kribbella speibonae]|uniref:Uncharacterized protein n=1 Tax=Kribbella speibonae TaxID=1572660 RepID=A0A4R0IT36_9ACTN|nr:hypothetical protein [Kribbella speibonae]TCC27512.1 hypothetical protein E0H58_06025 [Kribbella speibonae]TCC35624.1 hypothetical protein E0H92_23110 [Kribbella speibonae]